MASPTHWGDFSSSEDEDCGHARSYCEVLRSGSPSGTPPPPPPLSAAPPSGLPPLRRNRAPPLPPLLRPRRSRLPRHPRPPGPRPPAPRLSSIVVREEALNQGGRGGWQVAGRKCRRPRRLPAPPLPSMNIRSDLPPDLAGLCFNCLSEEHVAAMCTNERVCLRCRRPGHIARECTNPRSRSPPSANLRPISERLGARVGPSPSPPRLCSPPQQRATPAHARLGPAVLAAGRAPSEHGRPVAGAGEQQRRGAPAHARLGPAVVSTGRVPSERAPAAAPEVGETSRRARPGSPSARPSVERCVIPRSTEVVAAEDALRWTLVAFTMGGRPRTSLSAVTAAVEATVPEAADAFSVHRFWPADFLLLFASRVARDAVANAGEVQGRGFSLRLSPWNRQLQATRRPFHYRIRINMEGVPPHVWSRSTAQIILGSLPWVERLGTQTANRADIWAISRPTRGQMTPPWCPRRSSSWSRSRMRRWRWSLRTAWSCQRTR
uniref:CCHC-type domain-containing protein n=1 Tax=Aegilops tauschii subsp. strangulata TaxID=200361 RepID=A0A453L7V4_AEGTS